MRFRTLLATALITAMATGANAAITYQGSAIQFLLEDGVLGQELFTDATLEPGLHLTTALGSIGGGKLNDKVQDVAGFPRFDTVFSFDTPMDAFGGRFDLGTSGFGQGLQFYILKLDNTEELVPVELCCTNEVFFGFQSTEAFKAVRIEGGTTGGAVLPETYALNDIVYSTEVFPDPGPGIPEPATWALMIGGFLGIGQMLRRQRRMTLA